MLMREGQTTVIYRSEYTAPAYWIDTVDLSFDLDPAKTRVLNRMRVRRNPDVPAQPLRLDGEELNLARVLVNGQGTSFKMEGQQLVLENLPEGQDAFDLEIFTTCIPAKNTKLMGLYVSNDSFFTQCEAEGFRRITYFLDRPDVMASYTVTLRADKARYPVLLSNGNLVEQGNLEDGRHFARWVDPHRKPSYLFALVAGRLVCREQRITSRAGKDHLLQVYVRAGDLDKTEHAMNSLMASVAWDEARFGLPLDLERFMIVATSDFNMGAMENKGLNIFNTKYVLASRHRHRHRLCEHRERGRPRVLPQLDRQPRDLPRLVPAVAQGRPDGLPRPGIQPGHGRQPAPGRSSASRTCARCASAQFPKTPAHGAPGAARQLPGDRQFLHHHGVREGCRSRPHDAHPGRPGRLCQGDGAVLRTPRRPGRDLRRLCPGHCRRQPGLFTEPPAAAVQALVQPGGHAAHGSHRPL
jgi:hypothetical protein